jgi:C-terminal processing protease CtpA/Prc
MNVLPHVQQAGIPTTGIHSDQLVRHLPTGWRFQLSNEVYQTIDGKIYEKIGIPPDVPIAMFNLDDFADGKDSVVEKAWDILRRRR